MTTITRLVKALVQAPTPLLQSIRKVFLSALAISFFIACSPLQQYADTAARWEGDILQLETLDTQQTYPKEAVLFLGSSSIRLWETIQEDVAPYIPIQRGYGGAHFYDLIHFTERLASPHNYQAVVCFVANDISGSNDPEQPDVLPEEVLRLFKFFIKQLRKINPDVPVFQIEITPTNSRWQVWNQIAEANRLIKQYCAQEENLYFIATRDYFIGLDGKPDGSLFVEDQLHLNREGYRIWSRLVTQALTGVLSP
ncbi:MAG: GDSL-type esterase/lipase family protein [Lutibacter sp.]|nr:GDSL-type esterase/lipase family protein [Lutibacter sp.]